MLTLTAMIDRPACFSYSGAAVDITPAHPVVLAGYAARRHPHTGTASTLEANAILLAGGGHRVLFVSADVLFFGRDLVTAITERACRFGLSAHDIVLTASHTHFAPATDRTKPLLGEVDDEYWQYLTRRVVPLVDRVMTSPAVEVALDVSRVEADLTVGRRRSWPLPSVTRRRGLLGPRVVMGPALHADRDRCIDVIRVVGRNDDVVAILWKFACHPVCFPHEQRVSAEYPGRARAALRHGIGNAIPVVFWQGFAGDVRPRIDAELSIRDRLQERLLTLCRGPRFAPVAADAWEAWADRLSEIVVAASRRRGRPLSGPLTSSAVDVPMTALIDTGMNPQWRDRSMRMQCVSFGTMTAVFIGAEVCSPYLRLLAPGGDTIGVGYAGDVFGYLPSARQEAEGGYEGRDFFKSFGLEGRLQHGFEDAIRRGVHDLRAAEAARRRTNI